MGKRKLLRLMRRMERDIFTPPTVRRLHQFLFSLKHDGIGKLGKQRPTFYPRANIPEIHPNPQYIECQKGTEVIVFDSNKATSS